MHRFYLSSRSLISENFCRWKCPVRRYVAIGRRGYLDKRTFLGPQLPRRAGNCLCVHNTPLSLNARGAAGLKYGKELELEIENEGRTVRITWDGGVTATFSAVWLRHNCQCPACVTSSNQKSVDPAILDPTMTVTPRHSSEGVLELKWSCGHSGYIEEEWLKCYQHSTTDGDLSRPTLATQIPRLSATALESDEGLWTWLKHLNEYGLCLLTDLPIELGTIKQVTKKFYNNGQTTIYGEIFDVIFEENPINIAYSNTALSFHMDLVYYESPPGLQLLHCIRNDDCVKGGESVLLDMFALVEQLRLEHPHHFYTLTRIPATFHKVHYDREDPVEMTRQRPHIVVDNKGRITALNWAPAFEGPLKSTPEDIVPYYEAYYCLANMLQKSNLKLSHRFQPGDVITFNNRRILHSRTGFELNDGVRHLQGAYVNIDEFKSKFHVLCSKLGHHNYPVKRVFNHQSN